MSLRPLFVFEYNGCVAGAGLAAVDMSIEVAIAMVGDDVAASGGSSGIGG